MGMIPGTFIVVDDVSPPTQDETQASQSAEQKFPVIETYRQRFIHEVKQLWQRLESFYQDVLNPRQSLYTYLQPVEI